MNFLQAFSETIGKESQNPNPTPTPEVKQDNKVDFTSDDMKAYVDAKFEALKSDLLNELKPVETPKETDNKNAKPEENQVKDADDNVNNK